uniref:40S ribosomal protein S27 n=2 Tax=Vombatus ursinus TaxID=29139 RepID=A0A4X2LH40_VOMUR
ASRWVAEVRAEPGPTQWRGRSARFACTPRSRQQGVETAPGERLGSLALGRRSPTREEARVVAAAPSRHLRSLSRKLTLRGGAGSVWLRGIFRDCSRWASRSADMPLARDLVHPSLEDEKKKHKKKRLVQSPNSYFMDVKCPGCYKITTVFSHAQTVVLCVGCSTVLCQPTGGKARLTEGCSFRRKQH